MKKRSLAAWTAVTAMAAMPALSANVGGLTTFTPGTPAVASEVNGNFSALATAVNSKQDRVTGTCTGSAITQVNADGSVGCSPFIAAGAASVSGHALISTAFSGPEFCRVGSPGSISPFVFLTGDPGEVSNGGCSGSAPISLPHGARLTGLTCRLSDTYDNGSISVSLARGGVTSANGSLIFSLPATTDGGEQSPTDETPLGGTDVVDNAAYSYYVALTFDLDSPDEFFDVEQDLMFGGCSVAYVAN